MHRHAEGGFRRTDSHSDKSRLPDPEVRRETGRRCTDGQVAEADLVIDCSDNFATRFTINDACVTTQTPLVSGAAIRTEGQISVFSGQPGDPCYRCLYGAGGDLDETCSQNGVLAPLVGIIGSMQAIEAIKILTGAGTPLSGRLMLLDATADGVENGETESRPEMPGLQQAGGCVMPTPLIPATTQTYLK